LYVAPFSSYLTFNNRDLEKVTEGHSNWYHSKDWGAVSYSPSIVTMDVSFTVYEIFSVKEWRDLETGGTGGSRLLKMAPFDRSHTTFYWSAIVIIALSGTVFELFDVE